MSDISLTFVLTVVRTNPDQLSELKHFTHRHVLSCSCRKGGFIKCLDTVFDQLIRNRGEITFGEEILGRDITYRIPGEYNDSLKEFSVCYKEAYDREKRELKLIAEEPLTDMECAEIISNGWQVS